MNREDALEIAAELLFDEYQANSYRGFSYHPIHGLVPWGRHPASMAEEQFELEATVIDEDDDLESLLMAIEMNPPR